MKIHDITYFFKNGIKNLVIWFPTIWKDRQWDSWFFYVLLRKKLILMKKDMERSSNYVDVEQDIDKIGTCIEILHRLIDDDYFEIAWQGHDEKWGEVDFKFSDTDNGKFKKIEITHPNVKTVEDEEEEREDTLKAMEKEEQLRNQDLDTLFELIRKHLPNWWY